MFLTLLASAAGHGVESAGHSAGPVLPMHAQPVFGTDDWILPITNSMVYTWIITALIILAIRLSTHNLKEIPSGFQNAVEALIEGMQNFMGSLLDKKVVTWAFPFLATFFIFILISNYMALMPGVGSIGWGHPAEGHGPFAVEHVDKALFRPPTADANMTVAMAAIFFIMNLGWAIKYNGLGGFIKHIFGVKGEMKGFMWLLMAAIFLAVGMIEVISIGIRPVALSMRLYGNVYGGESVLTIMLGMLPFGIAAIPFYFLELIVATVQALVFSILCIAFTVTLCSHTEEHGHH